MTSSYGIFFGERAAEFLWEERLKEKTPNNWKCISWACLISRDEGRSITTSVSVSS